MLSSKQPRLDTYRPVSKKDHKNDTCSCPVWCRGYLAKETEIVKGNLRPRRIFASLDTCDWTAAETEVAHLYERGCLPSRASAVAASATARSPCGTPSSATSNLAPPDR